MKLRRIHVLLLVLLLLIGVAYVAGRWAAIDPWSMTGVRLRVIKRMLVEYRAANGHFPKTLVGLRDSSGKRAPTRDGWGREFLYTASDDHARVGSLGADGRPGGEYEAGDMFEEIGSATTTTDSVPIGTDDTSEDRR